MNYQKAAEILAPFAHMMASDPNVINAVAALLPADDKPAPVTQAELTQASPDLEE